MGWKKWDRITTDRTLFMVNLSIASRNLRVLHTHVYWVGIKMYLFLTMNIRQNYFCYILLNISNTKKGNRL